MEELVKAPLARFTTLKIGGEADRLCNPSTVDELLALVERLNSAGEPWHVIGGGSNLLISSRGVDGTVIRLAQVTEVKTSEPEVIEAGTGARLPHLARWAAAHGLAGLEFAVGIPGTVGGAVVMNAGAHGSCIANVLESATLLDTKDGAVLTLTNSELGFEYRRSRVDPERHIVLSARFKLKSDRVEAVEERIQHNEEYRWKTQPLNWPNGGSTFKNPSPDRTAGQLLDQSGAKQLKQGAAAVSAVHANFVINMGGATSQDVIGLLKLMQDCVQKKFEVRLKPEWKKLGRFSPEELEVWNGEV
jgi:UDP-N-acetylmuramate dehydrogenase